MQERYLGDSHDYAKYALLRRLSRSLTMRIGVNWYLTKSSDVDRPDNKDGEKRHHFSSKKWDGWEIDLLDQLHSLQTLSARQLSRFYELDVLPRDTLYFDQSLPTADRSAWHRSARQALSAADLIFMDPDNGFEVQSTTRRSQPKYALYSEAADYLSDGKVVVSIQFARQCDPLEKARSVRRRLSELTYCEIDLPVVRARLAPNLLFVTVAPKGLERDVSRGLHAFAENREKIELVP